MECNVFLFTFENPSDLEKVFSKRPWMLRGAHLVFKKWAPDLLGGEIDFSKSTFWVQVHGLPGLWQQPRFLKSICGEIGRVVEEDFAPEVHLPWRKFIRIHVDVDITKPLTPGVFLPRQNRDDLWVGFKYEKLPDVCYNCGVIGHLAKNCGVPPTTLSNQFGVRFPAFGDWLSAVRDVVPPQIYEQICDAAHVDSDSDGLTNARNRILVTCPSAFPNPSDDNAILAHSTCPKTIDSIISGPNSNMPLGKAIVVSELIADSGRGAATSQDVLTQQVLGGEWCSTYFGRIMMTRSEILSVRPSNF